MNMTLVADMALNLQHSLSSTQMSSAADEPRVLCVVRDMTNLENQNKFTMNLPYTTAVRSFLKDVAERLGYVDDTFVVSYERPSPGFDGRQELEEVNVNDFIDKQLKDICIHCGDRKRNNFTVLDKDGMAPIRAEVEIH